MVGTAEPRTEVNPGRHSDWNAMVETLDVEPEGDDCFEVWPVRGPPDGDSSRAALAEEFPPRQHPVGCHEVGPADSLHELQPRTADPLGILERLELDDLCRVHRSASGDHRDRPAGRNAPR